ncbi:MAG: penicillin-binding transpeptidase domain-containing protein [Opitutaceae bacterium]
MSKGFASNFRQGLLVVAVLGGFGGVAARLVALHVVDRPRFLPALREARDEIIPEPACRGAILDVNGRVLATSLPMVVVGADPTFLRPEDRDKWPELARLIGVPLPELETRLTTKSRPAQAAPSAPLPKPGFVFNFDRPEGPDVGVAPARLAAGKPEASPAPRTSPVRWVRLKEDPITESAYAQVRRLGIRGVYGRTEYRRDYPHGELAAHLLGFVNHDQQAVSGLERYLDFYLRGEDGWTETETDGSARRRELPQFTRRDVPPADGYDVRLSINSVVQKIVDDELAGIAAKYQPHQATIIVSDPRTGFILGLGSYPTFDPNTYNRLPRDEQYRMNDVAVDSEYEPGSVFKIVAVSGAINDGLVTPETTFDCTLKSIDYEGRIRKLPNEDVSDHFDDRVPVSQIIARSSNRGAVQVAMRLGDRRFYDYARAFGFGQKTGFPVGGEIRGSLSSPRDWQTDATAITHIPMGQGVAVTAIQMHQAMCVIASGGLLLRPQIIRQILAPTGQVLFDYGPAVVRRVLSERTAAIMAQLLWGVVNSGRGAAVGDAGGTSPEAAIAGFDVAGKSGTANKVRAGGHGYSKHHHVASFVGFLPAKDPQIAISVVIDDADAHSPGGVAYGGTVAAPCFRDIALKLIPYLDIRPVRAVPPGARLAALEGGTR